MTKSVVTVFVVVIVLTLYFLYNESFGMDTRLKPAVLSPTQKQAASSSDDAALIREALFRKNEWPENENLQVVITEQDGRYAKGTVHEEGAGGGYFFAIKTDTGEWEIVADGNGIVFCTSLAPYPDYPVEYIPSCLNETGDLVPR